MENKLEQLLNSLIKKGWKPRGDNVNKVIKTGIDEFGDGYVLFDGELNGYKQRGCNMTELVSKGSGLWQFVCKNGMIEHKGLDIHSWEHTTAEHPDFWFTDGDNYEYYIIESSLKDESELEDFLLSNIKVEGK